MIQGHDYFLELLAMTNLTPRSVSLSDDAISPWCSPEQLWFGFFLRGAHRGRLPPHTGPRAPVPAPKHPWTEHTERDLPTSGMLRVTKQSSMWGAAWRAAWRPYCKRGAAEKRSYRRLSGSVSCFHSCGRCSVVASSASQKAGFVSVVLKHRQCVSIWRIHEPLLLSHDIQNDVISFFRESIWSFVSLTAQGKQVVWVLLLTTSLSHVVAEGLLNVRTSLMLL